MQRTVRAIGSALPFVLVIALTLSACAAPAPSPAPKSGEAPAAAEKHLRVAINNPVFQPGIAFLWLGNDPALNYFNEEKLTVEYVPAEGAGQSTQWLTTGQVDMALPQAGPLVDAAAQGQDLGLIGLYLLNRISIYELVVLPDSPIKTIEDIKGKKVGIVGEGDEGNFLYRAMMKELGYPQESNQVIVTGAVTQAAEALKKGTVDIEIWADTQRTLTEAQGYQWRELQSPKVFDKAFANVIMTRKEFLPKNRDAIVSYLRVIAKNTLFYVTNPDATLRIHFKLYPQTLPTGKSVDEAVKANLPATTVRIPKLQPKPGEKWGEMSAQNWEFLVRDYLGYGPEKVKDSSVFWTNDLIAEVNNFDAQKVIDQAKSYR